MPNYDFMVMVRDKFERTQQKYGISTQKQLINELNGIYRQQNASHKADKVHQKSFTQLKNAINEKQHYCKHANILNEALDKYIELNQDLTQFKEVSLQDFYHHIASKLNNDIHQPNAHFWQHSHYFVIRRAYSAKHSIILSVMKIHKDSENVIHYRNFRRSVTLKTNLLSKGFVFDISPNTINITGIVNSTDCDIAEVLIEHIHLNKIASNGDVYNGIYLGCCYKNTAYTPFSTRVFLLPIDISNMSESDVLELENFSSCPSIQRFMDKYNEATHPDEDCNDINKQKYHKRATVRSSEIIGNIITSEEAKHELYEQQYSHAVKQNKGYYIFRHMLEQLNIPIQELVYQRIVNTINKDDPFGGLREYRVGV